MDFLTSSHANGERERGSLRHGSIDTPEIWSMASKSVPPRFCCQKTITGSSSGAASEVGTCSTCQPGRREREWRQDFTRLCCVGPECLCMGVGAAEQDPRGIPQAMPQGPCWCRIHSQHITLGRPLFLLETQYQVYRISSPIPFLPQDTTATTQSPCSNSTN